MFGTEIKICGLTRIEDIIAVNRYGADYAGFVFCKKSKRYIDSYKAGELIDLLRSDITTVGVFLDEPLDNVISAARISGVQMIQLHGHESDEYVEYVRRTLERPAKKSQSCYNPRRWCFGWRFRAKGCGFLFFNRYESQKLRVKAGIL